MNWLFSYTGAIMEFTLMLNLIVQGEDTWGDNLILGCVCFLIAIVTFIFDCKIKARNDERKIEELANEKSRRNNV